MKRREFMELAPGAAFAAGTILTSLTTTSAQPSEQSDWNVLYFKVDRDKDCQKFDPRYIQTAARFDNVDFYKADLKTNDRGRCTSADWQTQKAECSQFVQENKVDNTPTIQIRKGNRVINQTFGTPDPDTLKNWIRNTIKAYESKDSLQIHHPRPEKVVVVPDEETAVHELLSNGTEYPIVLERDRNTKKFIEKCKPKEVVVKDRSKVKIDQKDILREISNPNSDGVVVVDMRDQRTMIGGLALAAAHNQRVVFINRGLYGTNYIPREREAEKIRDRIHAEIGDLSGLEYLTMACDLSYAFRGKYEFLDDKYSLDNLIARDKDRKKWAYHGRLTGRQALYQAMCSLFLQPKTALFFDTIWRSLYQTHHSDNAVQFAKAILDVTQVKRPECTEKRLREELEKNPDFVLFQSRGAPDAFTTYEERNFLSRLGYYEKTPFDNDGRGNIESLDLFNPTIFLANPHSYAGANPYDPNTIGGRVLREGAYIFYGAVSEPGRSSFNTPADIFIALLLGMTMGQATQDRSITRGSYYPPKKDGDFFYYDALQDGTKVSRLFYGGDPRFGLRLVRK